MRSRVEGEYHARARVIAISLVGTIFCATLAGCPDGSSRAQPDDRAKARDADRDERPEKISRTTEDTAARPPALSAPAAPALETPPPAVPDTANRATRDEVVAAADPSRADVIDIYRQAKALALSLLPEAKLTYLHATGVVSGSVDLTKDGQVTVGFEHAGIDPSQPPGRDQVERSVDVITLRTTLRATLDRTRALRIKQSDEYMLGAHPDPTCSMPSVFAALSASGVPANAVCDMSYFNHRLFTPASPQVWRVTVAGHEELTRVIDAHKCVPADSKLSARPDASPAAPDTSPTATMRRCRPEDPLCEPSPPPRQPPAPLAKPTTPNRASAPPAPRRPPAKGACGCRPDDLLCHMRCGKRPDDVQGF